MIGFALPEQLRSPEYLHVLCNPIPIYVMAAAIVLLVTGFLFNERAVRLASVGLILAATLSLWPAYHFGRLSYDRVESMADRDGAAWLREHARRANEIELGYIALGLASASALAAGLINRTAERWACLGVLIMALAALGAGAWVAHAGGSVRHREFRLGPPGTPGNGLP